MAQLWVRGHNALSKHQRSVPSTFIAQPTTASNSCSRISDDILFCSARILHLCAHMHAYTQNNMHN